MAGKIAKSMSITLGSTSYTLQELPWGKNESCDAVEVTSLADTAKQYIPAACKDADEFTVKILDGAAPAVGSVIDAVAISYTPSGADAATTVTVGACICTKVEYDSVASDGDRKLVYTVTLKPTGAAAS